LLAYHSTPSCRNSPPQDARTFAAIVNAIETGGQRIAALAASPDDLDIVADEIRMDGWRRRAARWTLAHEPDRIASFFSLGEMLALGDRSQTIDARGWGMSAVVSSGCLCTDMAPPGTWQTLAGRPE